MQEYAKTGEKQFGLQCQLSKTYSTAWKHYSVNIWKDLKWERTVSLLYTYKRIIKIQNDTVPKKSDWVHMPLSFCHRIFSGSHTNKVEHSTGLWESVSNQTVTLNLSTLHRTVRKWNKRSQSEHSGQLADLHVNGSENRLHYAGISMSKLRTFKQNKDNLTLKPPGAAIY